MSFPRKASSRCVHCGASITKWIWDSLDLEKHSNAAEKLEKEEYFDALCPYCGKRTVEKYSMICYDLSKGIFLQLFSAADSERFFYVDELLEGSQRLCYVYRIEDLAEKVLALQNGRDDRIVEMCKFWTLIKYAKQLNTYV